MMTATAPRLQVCPEYQLLLQQCQQTFLLLQRKRTLAARSHLATKRAASELLQLQENYAVAYSRLELHEQSCSHCQYISKIAGLDFESMAEALIQSHPPAYE